MRLSRTEINSAINRCRTPEELGNWLRAHGATRDEFDSAITEYTRLRGGTTGGSGSSYGGDRPWRSNQTSTQSGIGSGINWGSIGNVLKNGLTIAWQELTGAATNLYRSQMGQSDNLQTDNLLDLMNKVKNLSLRTPFELLEQMGDQILDQLKDEAELRSEINSRTSLTGDLSKDLREDIAKASIYAAQFGFTMKDVGDTYIKLVESSGKFAFINRATFEEMAPLARAFNMTMGDVATAIGEFEKIGVGANRTLTTISEVGTRSMELGLSGVKVTTDLRSNIGKLNEYGFQNGIKGLEKMIQKSLEFRTNMDNIYGIAKKVMDPQGAVDFAANLQVLGAAFGDFNDPMKMMYMAVNNVEGLQDAFVGAAQGLASYNEQTKKFEVSGVNLRKAYEIANLYGGNVQDLTTTAIAAAERSRAKSDLLLRGFDFDDKQMEFLTNLARMQDGEMVISIPENVSQKLGGELKGVTELALDKADQKSLQVLLQNQELFKDISPKDLAMQQLTETQQLTRHAAFIATYLKYEAAKAVGGENFVTNFVKNTQKELIDFLKQGEKKAQETGLLGGDAMGKIGRRVQMQTANITSATPSDYNRMIDMFVQSAETTKNARMAEEFGKYLKGKIDVNVTSNGISDAISQYLIGHPEFKDAFNNTEFVRSFLADPTVTR